MAALLTTRRLIAGAMLMAVAQCSSAAQRLVVFGDSYSDEGNLRHISFRAFPRRRFYRAGAMADGPLWPTLLAQLISSSNDSAAAVVHLNYANIGATACDENAVAAMVPSLQEQVGNHLSAPSSASSSSDLYMVQITGLNDYWKGPLKGPGDLDTQRLFALPQRITACRQSAAERLLSEAPPAALVMFGAAPRVTTVPYFRALMPQAFQQEALLNASLAQTAQLQELVRRLQQRFPNTRVVMYDMEKATSDVYDNPERYGIAQVSTPCVRFRGPPKANGLDILIAPVASVCPDPHTQYWYDSLHVTTAVHKAIAPDLFAFLQREGVLGRG